MEQSKRPPTLLLNDISDVFEKAILVVKQKINSISAEDDVLLTRLVELWSFYFGNVIPYIQGAFLPAQRYLNSFQSPQSLLHSPAKSEIRDLALTCFRQNILIPNLDKLKGFTVVILQSICAEYL